MPRFSARSSPEAAAALSKIVTVENVIEDYIVWLKANRQKPSTKKAITSIRKVVKHKIYRDENDFSRPAAIHYSRRQQEFSISHAEDWQCRRHDKQQTRSTSAAYCNGISNKLALLMCDS